VTDAVSFVIVRSMMVLLATILLIPSLSAQSRWTSFLQEGRAELDAAVSLLEEHLAGRGERFAAGYGEIQDLYVTARRERLPVVDYAELLAESVVAGGEPAPVDEVAEARALVEGAFTVDVPIPGTSTFAAAQSWLAGLARAEGFPVARFDSLAAEMHEAVASLSGAAASLVAGSVPIPEGALPNDITGDDRAGEALSIWTLRVLAADEPTRVRLLSGMRTTLARLGEEIDPSIPEALAELADSRRALLALRRLLPIGVQAYALVSPYTLAEPDRLDAFASQTEALVALLDALEETPAEVATIVYSNDPVVAFLVDTMESLLGSASDLQRYEFAAAAGIRASRVLRMRIALHRLRLEANTPPERPGVTAVESDAFVDFLAEGADYVAAARPWTDGERSRSGDSFRWAMLPILSHPYAGYTLGSLPEHSDTRAMVDAFASSIYEDAFRRLDASADEPVPVVVGDAIAPFGRVYRVGRREAADRLYEAFAAAAQGVSELGRDFDVLYAGGLSVAAYWSHTHGLHVAVVEDEDVAARVRARVDDWLALARPADTEQERIAFLARGLIALRRAILDEMLPLLDESADPAALLHTPRLPVALDILDDVASFAANPLDARAALAVLYGVDGGATTTDAFATDAVATDLHALLDRLREVEIPDRRLLAQLAGGEGE
jgi:hypothetical protein